MATILEIKNVKKSFPGFCLGEVNMTLEPGYILGVIGENGAGKSTLARLILTGIGMENMTTENTLRNLGKAPLTVQKQTCAKGDILIHGISERYHGKEAKEHLAFVMAQCPFSMALGAMANAEIYGTAYAGWEQETFEQYLRQYHIPQKRPLRRLSKGQQILFQLAFARAHQATLYVMDEPSGNLDVAHQQLLLDAMQEIVAKGEASIVYITHRLEDLEQVGDYILWLEQGRQIAWMSKEELLEQYLLVTGTKKQLDYVNSVKPHALFQMEQGEYHQEALVRRTVKLPLQLEGRTPTLQELMVYENAWKKQTNTSLFETETYGKKGC